MSDLRKRAEELANRDIETERELIALLRQAMAEALETTLVELHRTDSPHGLYASDAERLDGWLRQMAADLRKDEGR